jgi:trehalose 6-phosphate phosphatase
MYPANAHELTGTPSRPRIPQDADCWSLWLDLDGTLLDSTTLTADGRLDMMVVALLGRLREQLDGALAILSGRSIDQIDHMCAPLKLPASTFHGAQRRDARGHVTVSRADCYLDALVASKCKLATRLWRDVLVEHKLGSCHVLHFRENPRIEPQVREFARSVVDATDGEYEVRFGECMAVLKPASWSMSQGVRSLAQTRPFAGTKPVALCDEMTDECMFRTAASLGGFGVIVGERRPTSARYCLHDPEDAIAWLRALSRRLDWA